MGPLAFLSVAVGAALGALLRWAFGLALNAWVPEMPLGTLAANLLGGFVIGAAIGAFAQFQTLPPELRLFVTTGFCGGLTTFSTFSAETVTLLLRQQYGWAATVIVSHLAGSLLMTFAGVFAVRAVFRT